MAKFEHFELNTDDPEGSKRFYRALFGWKYEERPMAGGGSYSFIRAGAATPIGGIMRKPMAEAPNAWLGYVGVPAIRPVLARALAGGGRVIVDYTPIEGMGAFAVLTDPAGAVFALWEGIEKPKKRATKKRATKKRATKKRATKKRATKKRAMKRKPRSR